MKTRKITLSLLVVLAVVLSAAVAAAGDFDWTKDLDIRAEADPEGFRARLSARFNIGNAQIQVVLGNVDRPADAYMVFRLGEMSSVPVDYVLERYKADGKRGWGVLAKSLGIKPGSREFQALKEGGDLFGKAAKGNVDRKKGARGK
ncbi:MAG: hypothetical protein JSV26_04025 [bacterium]|nr:MAG: hypothetical protein JSV26_04025 [bacterium]